MAVKSPKLQLTEEEGTLLRKNKIKLAEIRDCSVDFLADKLNITEERAEELIALALFQSIPSVGPSLAHNVVNDLGFKTFAEIKEEKGEDLIIELEKKYGVWMDPCVEDVLRCVVYHANHPSCGKNWWDFTEERKEYRAKYGYPQDRPQRAWNENQ